MAIGEPTIVVRLKHRLVQAARTVTGQSRSTAAVEACIATSTDPTRLAEVVNAVNAARVATAIRAVQDVLIQLTGTPGKVQVDGHRWFVTVPGRRDAFAIPTEADPVLVAAELKRHGAELDLIDTAH